MSQIRACTHDDIPAVAGLFQKTFRRADAAAPASLQAYLATLFLDHPAFDAEIPSRVHVADDGRIDGFIGVLPLRMSLRGRPVRVAVAGSLMVDDPQANPLAGARLLRSYVNGPQDLSLSESANPISQAMWMRLGGRPLPTYSMEWLRVLRPAATAVALASHRAAAAILLRPVAAVADGLIDAVAGRPLRLADPVPGAVRTAEVDDEALADLLPRFADGYALHPVWDGALLRWILAQAGHKDRYGPLHRRVVYGRGDEPIGCYLYYGRPRDIAFVLQILARPKFVEPVIDDLLRHAADLGCVAVRGRTQPELVDPLLRRRVVMLHRSSTVVHTRDPEIAAAIGAGDALLVGLVAESWSRLIGDTFR